MGYTFAWAIGRWRERRNQKQTTEIRSLFGKKQKNLEGKTQTKNIEHKQKHHNMYKKYMREATEIKATIYMTVFFLNLSINLQISWKFLIFFVFLMWSSRQNERHQTNEIRIRFTHRHMLLAYLSLCFDVLV